VHERGEVHLVKQGDYRADWGKKGVLPVRKEDLLAWSGLEEGSGMSPGDVKASGKKVVTVYRKETKIMAPQEDCRS